MANIKKAVSHMLGPIYPLLRKLLNVDGRRLHSLYQYDEKRFLSVAGIYNAGSRSSLEAQIIMRYHVIEKGLTMPDRRLGFGRAMLLSLIEQIERFISLYGNTSKQVMHAIGVVREYQRAHANHAVNVNVDLTFWKRVADFSDRFKDVPPARQLHFSREDFYSHTNAPFIEFAKARHCTRHFSAASVSRNKIESAVTLATTAPSACNRNHGRVHCIADKGVCRKLLEIQGGNRGFGHLADKLLIVTVDTSCLMAGRERHDGYVNGGMFLMNLCYALYAYEVAYTILTWAVSIEADKKLRGLVNLPQSEDVVALLCIGEAPDEFDVPASPRRELSEVLTWHS